MKSLVLNEYLKEINFVSYIDVLKTFGQHPSIKKS